MILVTGTSGFIGSYLLDALIEKYGSNNIIALTSKPTEKCNFILHNNYQFDKEIFVKSGFDAIETIIHAGAFTPKKSSESNNIEGSNSNIYATTKLIESNLPKLKKFIFLSTLDVYSYDNPITELSPVNPVSLYGQSKLYCEKMLSSWSQQNNTAVLTLRIGHVYGPGEEKYQKLIPLVMKQIINNLSIKIYGSGTDVRTFIYITDVINSILKSIELESSNETINIVGNEQISINDLIIKIIEISGKNVIVERIESDSEPRNLIFDNAKLKKLLHNPIVSLAEGLRKEWEYLKVI